MLSTFIHKCYVSETGRTISCQCSHFNYPTVVRASCFFLRHHLAQTKNQMEISHSVTLPFYLYILLYFPKLTVFLNTGGADDCLSRGEHDGAALLPLLTPGTDSGFEL